MILNAGCGGRPNDKACSVGDVRIDVKSFKEVTLRMDAHCLGFKDVVFEKVVCFEVIEHLESPYQALKEFKRVLKRNGEIIVSIPNIWYWRRIVKTKPTKYEADPPPEEYHKQGWDIHEFNSLAHSIGLEIAERKWLDWYGEKRKLAILDVLLRFIPQIAFSHIIFKLKLLGDA